VGGWEGSIRCLFTVQNKQDFSKDFLEDRNNRFLETLVITRLHTVITPNTAVSFSRAVTLKFHEYTVGLLVLLNVRSRNCSVDRVTPIVIQFPAAVRNFCSPRHPCRLCSPPTKSRAVCTERSVPPGVTRPESESDHPPPSHVPTFSHGMHGHILQLSEHRHINGATSWIQTS